MVRDLRERLPGRIITGSEISWDRTVGYPDSRTFVTAIRGHKITAIERRGKFALLALEVGGTLAIHRGMTGSLLLRPNGHPDDRFVRARFYLDDGSELRLDDSRKFGRIYLITEESNGYNPPWLKLGIEPLADAFTTTVLMESFHARRVAIKTALLNQRLVAGIGNIYADESLFGARIHPLQPAGSVAARKVGMLRDAIVHVLNRAILARGTTFSTYKDVDGQAGHNQERLQVFGRQGQPCPRCSTTIKKIVVGGRGTHFCPNCQKLRKVVDKTPIGTAKQRIAADSDMKE